MSPDWKRIADELRAVSDDRALAAANEPDAVEARLLQRESVMLGRAAMLAGSGLQSPTLSAAADASVVVDGDDLTVWGMPGDGDAALRAMAKDPSVDVNAVDAARVLAAVLGVRPDGPSA